MKRPYLVPIEPSLSSPEALILMDGYCSERLYRLNDRNQWSEAMRQVGWRGSIYYLWWDASDCEISLESFAELGIGGIAHWQKHKSFAKRVGKSFLPKLTCDLEEESVSFLGFGLGAYIAYYAMHDWYKACLELQNVILLAAIIRRDRTKAWGKAASRISGNFINVYNSEDLILKRFCQILDWNCSPCGIKPIIEEHPNIVNFNAKHWMLTAEHSCDNFMPVLKEIITQNLWTIDRQ